MPKEKDIEIVAQSPDEFAAILTMDALDFLAGLQHEFGERREALLRKRVARQDTINAGDRPDFLAETASVRETDWKVAEPPADMQNLRLEITGPVDRKIIINALNSGADCFMADFEDAIYEFPLLFDVRVAVGAGLRVVFPDGFIITFE